MHNFSDVIENQSRPRVAPPRLTNQAAGSDNKQLRINLVFSVDELNESVNRIFNIPEKKFHKTPSQ